MRYNNTVTSATSHDTWVNVELPAVQRRRMPATMGDGHSLGSTATDSGSLTDTGRRVLLAEFPTLHASAAEQLAVLLLRHALAALLDHRPHVGIPRVLIAFLRTPVTYAFFCRTLGPVLTSSAPHDTG